MPTKKTSTFDDKQKDGDNEEKDTQQPSQNTADFHKPDQNAEMKDT